MPATLKNILNQRKKQTRKNTNTTNTINKIDQIDKKIEEYKQILIDYRNNLDKSKFDDEQDFLRLKIKLKQTINILDYFKRLKQSTKNNRIIDIDKLKKNEIDKILNLSKIKSKQNSNEYEKYLADPYYSQSLNNLSDKVFYYISDFDFTQRNNLEKFNKYDEIIDFISKNINKYKNITYNPPKNNYENISEKEYVEILEKMQTKLNDDYNDINTLIKEKTEDIDKLKKSNKKVAVRNRLILGMYKEIKYLTQKIHKIQIQQTTLHNLNDYQLLEEDEKDEKEDKIIKKIMIFRLYRQKFIIKNKFRDYSEDKMTEKFIHNMDKWTIKDEVMKKYINLLKKLKKQINKDIDPEIISKFKKTFNNINEKYIIINYLIKHINEQRKDFGKMKIMILLGLFDNPYDKELQEINNIETS